MNFPGFFSVPYIAATSPEDGTQITVSVSGHFRGQSNLDVATFQEDGTLNLLENDGKAGDLHAFGFRGAIPPTSVGFLGSLESPLPPLRT